MPQTVPVSLGGTGTDSLMLAGLCLSLPPPTPLAHCVCLSPSPSLCPPTMIHSLTVLKKKGLSHVRGVHAHKHTLVMSCLAKYLQDDESSSFLEAMPSLSSYVFLHEKAKLLISLKTSRPLALPSCVLVCIWKQM